MEITLPDGCGNAPRINIVGDFAVNWATGNSEAVSDMLTADVSWTRVGGDTLSGPEAAQELGPSLSPVRVVLLSIITHGRLASCDGYLEAEDSRIDFSHALRFASTSKTAKIKEVRSYCIEVTGNH